MTIPGEPWSSEQEYRLTMFGLAVGGALGAPAEFLKLDQIRAGYGSDGINGLPDPALFTDDTLMSVAIAGALVKAGEKGIESIMEAVRGIRSGNLQGGEVPLLAGRRSWILIGLNPAFFSA